MSVQSNLERVLNEGTFAVTGELGPKRGVDTVHLREMAQLIKPYCDAFNITDNQTAVVRMSSIATGIMLKQMEMDPVIQIVTRDRNRLAIQADVLGAAAFGVMNVLALSGDHQTMGNHPGAKNVYDLDSMQLIQCLVGLREGRFMNGEELETDPPHLFVGAAINPFGHPMEFRVTRLAKKIKAGAQFVQSQPVYAMDIFKKYMEDVRNRGLHEKCHIMAGIIPIKSIGMAKYMRDKVAGVIVPNEKVERLQKAADTVSDKKERIIKVREEAVNMAVEEIHQCMEIPGVHGVHIMAVAWEEIIPEVLKKAGLDKERPKYKS
ncbi:methylenetetrahydrofolate reductase [Desulforhabdus amnigena]|jgi:methylenetetrahydrofolate reductase (NADPH)|uniref:Methylenetetrahydrofolate reductase n=1 Tax=Desulforhabdus amnigena TaxID=40218 RepID=A0A9W6LA08_9BACT|nr:methylenetetrahydrofolate reductase [Desulforhabdus amnigena]NLJ29592.1 methylenetetrahydrofolate reductase [Deltaproteobacteria bacterium]GLI35685.1 methylenetetrahydrofolate reductase [Desulforhabdus amnigena]